MQQFWGLLVFLTILEYILSGSACAGNTRRETSRRLSTIEDLITVKRWPALKQSDPLKLLTYLYLDYVKFMNQQIV
jgi:hypothetical protein